MTPSKARQRLRQLQQKLPDLLDPFFTRHRLFPGGVYSTQRRCGRANCRCARGERHQGTSVSFVEQGHSYCDRLTASQRATVEPLAQSYRQFREARREVRRTLHEILSLVEELEASLRVSPSEYVAELKEQTKAVPPRAAGKSSASPVLGKKRKGVAR